MTHIARKVAALTLLLGLAGCEHHFFKVHGYLASDGGELGSWRSPPQGCARDQIIPLAQPLAPGASAEPTPTPANQPATIAAFFWRDERLKDKDHLLPVSDGPLLLAFSHSGPVVTGALETVRPGSGSAVDTSTLDASACSHLELSTHEGKPAIAGGKPTLAGTLALDCRVRGSHLTAHFHFSGCEF